MNKTMLLPLFLVACGGAPVEFSAELTAVDAGAEATVMVGAGGSGQGGRVGVGGAVAGSGGTRSDDASDGAESCGPPLCYDQIDPLIRGGCLSDADCCRGLRCEGEFNVLYDVMVSRCVQPADCASDSDCPCRTVCATDALRFMFRADQIGRCVYSP